MVEPRIDVIVVSVEELIDYNCSYLLNPSLSYRLCQLISLIIVSKIISYDKKSQSPTNNLRLNGNLLGLTSLCRYQVF